MTSEHFELLAQLPEQLRDEWLIYNSMEPCMTVKPDVLTTLADNIESAIAKLAKSLLDSRHFYEARQIIHHAEHLTVLIREQSRLANLQEVS